MRYTITREALIVCILATLFVGGLIGFFFGTQYGVHQYLMSNCFSYPFLLLDPSKYLACALPGGG